MPCRLEQPIAEPQLARLWLHVDLAHHGDVASGDSGGPFFGFWQGDPIPYAVGTTSGHETISGPSWTGGEDNNIEAGGALMVLAIAAAELVASGEADRALLERHYEEHVGKPFYEPLVEFMLSGPVAAMVLEGSWDFKEFHDKLGDKVGVFVPPFTDTQAKGVVEFPGNKMTGEGFPILVDLVDRSLQPPGDVVVTTGTSRTTEYYNSLGAVFNMPWKVWLAHSALKGK